MLQSLYKSAGQMQIGKQRDLVVHGRAADAEAVG